MNNRLQFAQSQQRLLWYMSLWKKRSELTRLLLDRVPELGIMYPQNEYSLFTEIIQLNSAHWLVTWGDKVNMMSHLTARTDPENILLGV